MYLVVAEHCHIIFQSNRFALPYLAGEQSFFPFPLLPFFSPPHADQAASLTGFITEDYLPAALPDDGDSAGGGFGSLGSPEGDSLYHPAAPSRGTVLKGQALKALARALAPSSLDEFRSVRQGASWPSQFEEMGLK